MNLTMLLKFIFLILYYHCFLFISLHFSLMGFVQFVRSFISPVSLSVRGFFIRVRFPFSSSSVLVRQLVRSVRSFICSAVQFVCSLFRLLVLFFHSLVRLLFHSVDRSQRLEILPQQSILQLVSRPLNRSEAKVDLDFIQT